MDNVAVVVCLHGDEVLGLDLAEKISDKMQIFVGNPLAVKKGERVVNVDLNRSFPGDKDSDLYEERRAAQLLEKLINFDCIVDIHSSSYSTPLFGIITKPNEKKFELAKKLGLRRVIVMSDALASGKALIDHVKCGISLEIGPHEREENVKEVMDVIGNLGGNGNGDLEIFEVVDLVRGEDDVEYLMENFKPVHQGDLIARGKDKNYYAEYDFVPVFVGERAYKGILCLSTRKIN